MRRLKLFAISLSLAAAVMFVLGLFLTLDTVGIGILGALVTFGSIDVVSDVLRERDPS